MTQSTDTRPIRAHVFTDADPRMFLKQAPGMSDTVDGVTFSFGIDVAEDADVLILHTRASFSVPTRLPRERTAFIAGEPDHIHRYNPAYLNQFGLVLTTSSEPIDTEVLRENFCLKWYAGINYDEEPEFPGLLGHDYFSSLRPPAKTGERISIVTSRKAHTPFHKKRLQFIEFLKERIPDRIDLFGEGHRYVGDKREALEPYKYHLALENSDDDFGWTEKLSDPLLCWAFPFYSGCGNVAAELPAGCHMPLDLDDFDAALARMVYAMESDHYARAQEDIAEARRRILGHYNAMSMLARVSRRAYEAAPDARPASRERLIYAERAFPPGDGHRGSRGQAMARRAILAVYPRFDLLLARQKKARDVRHQRRNRLRHAKTAGKPAPKQA
ncbi:hypothetical protein [Oricola thermophila]|uniref:Glycosyltransferase n=1 Tax=Oricola thermophila TaxID=2742145 RepID=A0A6N1VDM6_9HYPH|nr:hypothetical protein [Oricola thermophila]QKV18818.1 hypothetical protein HTY61_10325 [Oricola thermophila]